ncbi:MAG: S-methyl-5'-thioinosine phosphorylase [Gammaproteobacteria bacterium]
MSKIAIIGGTGMTMMKNLEIVRRELVHTTYGEPSGPITLGTLAEHEIIFLARHGYGHTIPPHKINYRANIAALKDAGAEMIIAINAVGGITANMRPEALVIPDQIIDYTWSRTNTFFEEGLEQVVHIDFTHPYCEALRQKIIKASQQCGVKLITSGTYGATQGPRLETAAEVTRLERDGCDIVGMTGMPEAALARELGLCYASICVVANMAAGKGPAEITMEDIDKNLQQGMEDTRSLLAAVISMCH